MATRHGPNGARQRPVEHLALIALVAGAVAIGFAPVFARVSEAGPVATAFFRMALAAPILWGWWWATAPPAAASPDPWRPTGFRRARPPRHLLWVSGLLFAIDLAIWHWAIHFTTVANATLLANTAPILVTIAARVLYDERVSHAFVVGTVLAFLGAAVLLGVDLELSRWHLLGDGLSLVAALFYAGYLMSVKELRRHHSVSRIMTVSATTSAIVLLPLALISPEPNFLPLTTTGWLVLVGLALVSHAAGQSLIAYALAHLRAGFSALTLLIQPVVAAALAWWWVDERLTTFQVLGGLLVLAGVFVAKQGTEAGIVTGLGPGSRPAPKRPRPRDEGPDKRPPWRP